MDVLVYYGFASSSEQRAAIGYGLFFTCVGQMRRFEEMGGLFNPLIPKPLKDGLGRPYYPVKDTELKFKGEIHTKEREIFLRTLLDILNKCMDAQTMTIYADVRIQEKLGKVAYLLAHPRELVRTHERDYVGIKDLTEPEKTLLKSIYYKLNIPTGREIKDRDDRRTVMFAFTNKKNLGTRAAMHRAKFMLGETLDSKPVKYSVYLHSQAIDDYQDLTTQKGREFSLGFAALAVKREENGVPLAMSTLSNADVIVKGVAISYTSPNELYLQALLQAAQETITQLLDNKNISITLITKDKELLALFTYPGIIDEYSEEVRVQYQSLRTIFLSLSEIKIVCVSESDVYGQRCLTLCDELADTASYEHKTKVLEYAKNSKSKKKKKKRK